METHGYGNYGGGNGDAERGGGGGEDEDGLTEYKDEKEKKKT